MSFHPCPIEPDDWANGPDEPELVDCPECGGDGVVGPAAQELTCGTCGGSGEVEPPEPELDWFV